MRRVRRRPRQIDDALLRRLWGTRMTEGKIAEKIGHSRSAVRRRAVKIGLSPHRKDLWEKS